ncbi:S-layer homology domain-containing protein [Abyssisolibacter fermentans]|uniref:S-layer homology domain-containing protein n=1 Tax=Abyssisolibacter fermentans TaxID=1766203 RepID=UPI0012E36709|nr:S-layer homology domain-containing protein [Abyssisolibacter fermentans]
MRYLLNRSVLTRFVICILFILLISNTVLAESNNVFIDVKDTDWYANSIDELVEKKIINGYPDNTFKPNNNINVDAFLKIVISSLDCKVENNEDYWALGYIQKAIDLGLVDEGEFIKYNRPISRGEMAKIIVRSIENEIDINNLTVYKTLITDYENIDASLQKYVLQAFSEGIITGYPNGEFKPNENATRAQACIMIIRTLDESKRKIPTIPLDLLSEYPILEKKMYLNKEKEYLEYEKHLYDITANTENELLALELEIDDIEKNLAKIADNLIKTYEPYIYDNGDQHFGKYENNTFYGNTLFILKDGTKLVYTNYKNDVANGNGMIIWNDGDKYIGNFKDSKKHGKGKYVFNDGNEYIGYFKDSDFDGKGLYRYVDNERYIGSFKQDQKSGIGIYYFSNGNKYIGDFKKDLFDGKGIFVCSNNNKTDLQKYIGNFKNDKRIGNGISYWKDGSKHIGFYNNDIIENKPGCYINSSGDIYIRNEVVSESIEQGKYIWNNGLTYIGLFDKEHNRLCVNPQYIYNDDTIFNETVNKIIDKIIKPDMSDLKKEKAIHNYLIKNTVYYKYEDMGIDNIPEYCHTAFGVLVLGTGVCDGYAEAANILLNKVGIESKLVFGYAKNTEITDDAIGHAWNLVKINNKYYHLDVTWDDNDENNKIYYDFFNLTEKEIQKTHKW